MLAPSHPMQKTFGFLWATLFYLTLLAQSSLLGLYNSHEGTSADQNEILWHLSPTLKTLGYEVRYHDVATSLPECRDHDVGIVTWFRSGEMKRAQDYIQWLVKCREEGLRVLVFGSFGAYRDLDSEKWLEPEELNPFFETLSAKYLGNWSGNPSLISWRGRHPLLVSTRRFPQFVRPSEYLQFVKHGPELMPLATLLRSDLKRKESHVMFVSPGGGMVMAPYVGHQPPAPMPFQCSFNRPRFLKLALTYEGKEADHRVLCFYRGEEQSNGTTSNPFKAMLHQTLIQEGLEPTYWDISQGLPPEADVRGVPWVIAWFQETEMKGAIDYINFMTDRVHDGSKVMLLGELNFLRELHQQRWLSRSKVNQLLNAMGLAYGGQWTQQQSLLRGLSFDQRYFKTSLDQVMQSLSAFRYIAEKHPNCKTLLKVKREDTKVRSSMVVATPFGLYVDSALLESSPRHPKGLLDLPKLVTDVLRGAVKAPP